MMTIEDFLERTYYDAGNQSAFGSVKKLYIAARREYPHVTKKDVSDWLRAQLTYTLHKPIRRKFKRNRVLTTHIDQHWQADLADMAGVASANNQVKYLLNVIDVFSKYGWSVPLKSKKPTEVLNGFKKVFSNRKPLNLQTDKGGEFTNNLLKNYFKKVAVNHFMSQNEDVKCSVAERFNQTLKSKIFKYFTANNTNAYIDKLQQFVDAYNNRTHRSTKMKPVDVKPTNQRQVFFNLYDGMSMRQMLKESQKVKLSVNDKVRISKHRGTFDKGYLPKWTEEVFQILRGQRTTPRPVYKIKDELGNNIKGSFYPEEVQKVNITNQSTFRINRVLKRRRRRGQVEYFVEWKGYPKEFNSWITSDQLSGATASHAS